MKYLRLVRGIAHSIKRSFIVWQMNEATLAGKELWSCVSCGMARTEPCEHWLNMKEEEETE